MTPSIRPSIAARLRSFSLIAPLAALGLGDPAVPPDTDAPQDLSVMVARERGDAVRVTMRRPGHLVILRSGETRGAGQGAASIRLDSLSNQANVPVRWETAELSSLAAARGDLGISMAEGADLDVAMSLADTPQPVTTLEGHLHRCAAHADGSGGFYVLCRLKAGAWRVGAANVTGDDPVRDVWLISGMPEAGGSVDPATGLRQWDAFARLDLPLDPGAVESRLLGYLSGTTGVVLRAEATRLPGEEPSIVLSAASRVQPFTFFPRIPMPRRRHSLPLDFDLL